MAISAALTLPCFCTDFLPVTDLPQHLAQLRLLLDTAGDPYEIAWLAPNGLVYYLGALTFWGVGERHVAAAWTALLVFGWGLGCFALGRRAGAHWSSPLLASTVVYSGPLYWGFFNFLVGWPVFVAFVLRLWGAPCRRRSFALFAMSGLLLWAHALWFAMGCVVLSLVVLAERRPLAQSVLKAALMLPFGLSSLVWLADLRAYRKAVGFELHTLWIDSFLAGLNPVSWLTDGLVGPLPLVGIVSLANILTAAYLVWALAARTGRRGRDHDRSSWALSIPPLAMGAVYFVAPDIHLVTMDLASRWFPVALAWLLATSPPFPRLQRTTGTLAVAISAVFLLQSVIAWSEFGRVEMSGLEASLREVDRGDRILGLDLIPRSSRFGRRLFVQVPGYATAFRGATSNFSFAAHGTSIVRYRDPSAQGSRPWTRGLEVQGFTVTRTDYDHFDKALVNLPETEHERYARQPWLRPLTTLGRWRLYEILHAATTPAPSPIED